MSGSLAEDSRVVGAHQTVRVPWPIFSHRKPINSYPSDGAATDAALP